MSWQYIADYELQALGLPMLAEVVEHEASLKLQALRMAVQLTNTAGPTHSHVCAGFLSENISGQAALP